MPITSLFARLGHTLGRVVAIATVASGVIACGQPETGSEESLGTADQPIIGGRLDRTTTGVVALVLPEPPLVEFCSGSLLARNLVLTARHCVSVVSGTTGSGTTEGQIQCGVSQFEAPRQGDQFFVSPDAIRPDTLDDPSFVQGAEVRVPSTSTDFCGNDVALLILAGKGISANAATPIVPRIDVTPVPGEEFSAEGFGLTEPDSKSSDGSRMRVDGDTVRCAGTDCRTETADIGATEWLSMDAQICPGDSGGPAFDTKGRTMGVASRGADGCSTAVYGDVASWKDFIVSTAKDAARLGGYTPPFWVTSGASTPGVTAAEEVHADPLGEPCSSACADGYACYSATAKPPGICVPSCMSTTQCPTGYACATSLAVCVPDGSPALPHRSSSGCSMSSSRGPRSAGMAPVLATAAFAIRRRRRRARRAR